MTNNPYISVVTPVYGCNTSLIELCLRLKNTLEQINPDFEIILVNDASPDGAWETIVDMAQKDQRVKGINLSRNFGQHYAITAGLDHCKGEWIVVMDCDLQDQPEEIIRLHEKAFEGFDIVFGKRNLRNDPFFRKMYSKLFYLMFKYFTGIDFNHQIANFSIINRLVCENIKKFNEHNRAFPLLVNWIGFRATSITVEHSERTSGKSAYNFWKLLIFGFNLIISYSNRPLKMSIILGLLMACISFLLGIILIIKKIFLGILIEGWTSIMVSIFFLSGLLFIILGIIGMYLGKVYEEVKNRPLYSIKDKTWS